MRFFLTRLFEQKKSGKKHDKPTLGLKGGIQLSIRNIWEPLTIYGKHKKRASISTHSFLHTPYILGGFYGCI